MTVCVAVQVNDCIVFAADSASSMVGQDLAGQPYVTNVYNHGRKVFCLRKGLPVMAMTCGMGNICGSSIDVLAKDLRRRLTDKADEWCLDPSNYTIENIAKRAHEHFVDDHYANDPHKPAGPHSFEMYIAGLSSGQRLGEVWKISIINGNAPGAEQVSPMGQHGVIWAGQPEALNRLILGYSGAIPTILEAAGIVDPQLTLLMQSIRSQTQAALTHPAMPVQDAVDLAGFLVATTIDFTKYLPGANSVGGDIDVATVTRHEGFKWIRRKHYYPAGLNPLETDHVGGR